MVHGLLIHGHEEFFICRSPASALGREAGQENVLELLTSLDPEEWHHGFQVAPLYMQGSCRVCQPGPTVATTGNARFGGVGTLGLGQYMAAFGWPREGHPSC